MTMLFLQWCFINWQKQSVHQFWRTYIFQRIQPLPQLKVLPERHTCSLNLVMMVETSVFGAKLPISNIIALTLFSDISNQNLLLPQDSWKLNLQSSRSRREISLVFLGFSSTWERKWIYMRTYFRQKSKKTCNSILTEVPVHSNSEWLSEFRAHSCKQFQAFYTINSVLLNYIVEKVHHFTSQQFVLAKHRCQKQVNTMFKAWRGGNIIY